MQLHIVGDETAELRVELKLEQLLLHVVRDQREVPDRGIAVLGDGCKQRLHTPHDSMMAGKVSINVKTCAHAHAAPGVMQLPQQAERAHGQEAAGQGCMQHCRHLSTICRPTSCQSDLILTHCLLSVTEAGSLKTLHRNF